MPKFSTKEEKLNYLFDLIDNGEKELDKQAKKWDARINNYEGIYFEYADKTGHQYSANLVQGISRLIIPSIYFRDPKIVCSPRRRGGERNSRITESLLNYWIKEAGLKREAKQVILDAFLFGMGYAKLGYEVRTQDQLEPVTNLAGEPLSNDSDEELLQDEYGGVFSNKGGKQVPILDPDATVVPEGKEVVSYVNLRRRDEPWVKRWEPWNVIRDPEALEHDLSDARWVAFRSILPLEEVKNNPFYKNTSNLRGTEIPKTRNREEYFDFWKRFQNFDEEEERVELYEVWSREWNKQRARWDMYVCIIAKGHKSFLLEKRSPYQAEGFPCKVLYFIEHPKSQWAPSMIEIIDPQINTINQVLTYIANFREKYVNKYLYNLAVLQEPDAKKIIEGVDSAVGVTIDPEQPIENIMGFLPVPTIPEWIFKDYDLAWEIIMRNTGFSDYQFGGQGIGRSPTEASYIQGSFNVRVNEQQDIVGEFVMSIAQFWKQLLQQFGDYKMMLKITGELGQEEWVEFTLAEDIPDDLDWNVEVYPAEHNSKQVELDRALAMYNLLRQDPLVNPVQLLERVFRAFGETAPESFIIQMPAIDPMTGLPMQHGGAADAGAIDVNQMRQPIGGDGGNTGRAL